MLNDLKEIIAINSVGGEPQPDAPLGQGPKAALDWFTAKARSFGLTTGGIDGYVAWAETGSGRLTGMLAHLDVVPSGGGWTTDPFTLTVDGGRLYGRGVCDDKGPAVAALHALNAAAKSGKLHGRVRLIVGANEESGCECVKRYVNECEIPVYSFTPDAEFPVVCSEKAIAHVKIDFADDAALDGIISICGGERANIVPSFASATLGGSLADRLRLDPPDGIFRTAAINEELAVRGCLYSDFSVTVNGGITVEAHGTAAHGSTPEKGDNALRKLFAFLSAITDSPSVRFIDEYLAQNNAAERLGIAACDEQSGALTLNLGIVRLANNRLTATIDLRLPLCLNIDEALAKIREKLPVGATATIVEYQPNLYVSPDSPLVASLLSVYEKHFGGNARPLRIGGGTYAKALPGCVAFGPTPAGIDCRIHDADEFLPVELFYKLKDVYYDAIMALDALE